MQPVPGSSKPNVVGEDSSFVNIVVTMNGINAVDDRNTKAGGKSTLLHLTHHGGPSLSRCLRSRHTASTTQYTACKTAQGCQMCIHQSDTFLSFFREHARELSIFVLKRK